MNVTVEVIHRISPMNVFAVVFCVVTALAIAWPCLDAAERSLRGHGPTVAIWIKNQAEKIKHRGQRQ